MERHLDFTTGKIIGPLMRFAVPVLLAMFLQALYGAIDLAIVGQFSSPADVSADFACHIVPERPTSSPASPWD